MRHQGGREKKQWNPIKTHLDEKELGKRVGSASNARCQGQIKKCFNRI